MKYLTTNEVIEQFDSAEEAKNYLESIGFHQVSLPSIEPLKAGTFLNEGLQVAHIIKASETPEDEEEIRTASIEYLKFLNLNKYQAMIPFSKIKDVRIMFEDKEKEKSGILFHLQNGYWIYIGNIYDDKFSILGYGKDGMYLPAGLLEEFYDHEKNASKRIEYICNLE